MFRLTHRSQFARLALAFAMLWLWREMGNPPWIVDKFIGGLALTLVVYTFYEIGREVGRTETTPK